MLQVKAVASNVRALDRARLAACSVDSDWPAAEGVVLLLQTLADAGSIRSLENRQGREVALYRGDRFVGVLAHRRSSTSEYGEVPSGVGVVRAGGWGAVRAPASLRATSVPTASTDTARRATAVTTSRSRITSYPATTGGPRRPGARRLTSG